VIQNEIHMLKNYKFWFKAGSWALVVTALLHSLSLLQKPVGENETERQLFELMMTYTLSGVNQTMYDLYFFFSLSMTLFTLFVAALNLMFAKYYMPSEHARKFILANVIFWTIFLIPLSLLTFILPIACYAMCWLFFVVSFVLSKSLK